MYYTRPQQQRPRQGRRPFFRQRPSGPPARRERPRPERVVLDEGKLRIIVLGGAEEVGRNMTVFEYDRDIVIVDMGLQFPEEDTPGIDYIIPNITYLHGKEKNIRGVIITHGHYDHIGGIPHLIPRLGNPMIYAAPLTAAIIKKRQTDFGNVELPITQVTVDDVLTLGKLRVEFIHVNHNIPDSLAIVIHTPLGTYIHTGDWKLDLSPADQKPADLGKFARIGSQGVVALLGDSTNAWLPGHQVSEQEIGQTLQSVIEHAPGRIIIGTFASLLSRVDQILRTAEEAGKKIAVDGYSMKTNVEIGKVLGYLKVKSSSLIDISQVDDYPPEKIIIMCTGAQGEGRAVLMRIANDEHRFVRIQPKDTVIFSSSVVPGNERAVQRLRDTLARKGAEIIHYQMMDVHAGGHGKSEDVKLLLTLVRPQYYIPIEGNHFMLRLNGKNAAATGIPESNVLIVDNGQVIEFALDKTTKKVVGRLTNERVPTDYVMVDGLGVGDVSQVVLRDRQVLAADGMVVIIATIEKKTGRLLGNPDIISRGFVYMKENKKLIEDTRHKVKNLINDRDPKSEADEDYIKSKIRNEIGRFLFQKTERRPMILPVVIEV